MKRIVRRKMDSRLLLFAAAALSFGCASTRAGGDVAQQLSGADWRLTELNGGAAVPADASRRPWLRFQTDSGRVVGSGGCNRMSGPFTANGASIDFGAILSTKMACADPAMNCQEAELFVALDNADRYEVSRDTLVLMKGGAGLARFTR